VASLLVVYELVRCLSRMVDFFLGGISFLSRFHGWASDNVRNYEVRPKVSVVKMQANTLYRSSSATDQLQTSTMTRIPTYFGLCVEAVQTLELLLALILKLLD
jgi:hypothetical protein